MNQDELEQGKQQLLEGTALWVDVREQEEWDTGHLEGAYLLPLSTLDDPAATLDLPKDRPIYLYCRKGGRAMIAEQLLKGRFPQARGVAQGFEELCSFGFPSAL